MYLTDITENETESLAIFLNTVRRIMSKPELKTPRAELRYQSHISPMKCQCTILNKTAKAIQLTQ